MGDRERRPWSEVRAEVLRKARLADRESCPICHPKADPEPEASES